jgi:molybdopterin synthase sulfur carrier subunit
MAVIVKYFASLREQMGKAEERLELDERRTVAEVWARVSEGKPMPENLQSAVNLEYVARDHRVDDGDEVAFFPPVTGG